MATNSHTGHHIVPLRVYVIVGLALFVLTGLTIAVSFVHMGGFNAVVAFAIAALKTALVAAIFMHLWYDHRVYFLVFLTAIAFLAVFIAFTMFDVLRRADLYDITAHPIQPNAAMYEGRAAAPAGHPEAPADTAAADSGHQAP
jgi:cytochrome c oxidase subunit 4